MPTMAYTMVKILPAVVTGEMSPYPTVARVMIDKYSPSIQLRSSTKR